MKELMNFITYIPLVKPEVKKMEESSCSSPTRHTQGRTHTSTHTRTNMHTQTYTFRRMQYWGMQHSGNRLG